MGSLAAKEQVVTHWTFSARWISCFLDKCTTINPTYIPPIAFLFYWFYTCPGKIPYFASSILATNGQKVQFYHFLELSLSQETVPCAFKVFLVMDYLKALDSWEPPVIYMRPNTHWQISFYIFGEELSKFKWAFA